MSEIKFSTEEKQIITHKIQKYFERELDQDLGQFDAEFLLDFFSKEVGSYFYNRGVSDAKAVLDERIESISDALYEIEKPVSR